MLIRYSGSSKNPVPYPFRKPPNNATNHGYRTPRRAWQQALRSVLCIVTSDTSPEGTNYLSMGRLMAITKL